MELIDLLHDPAETTNLADKHPDRVRELSKAYDTWLAAMADPITGGSKRTDGTANAADGKPLTEREIKREQIRIQKKKQRDAEKKAARAKSPCNGNRG